MNYALFEVMPKHTYREHAAGEQFESSIAPREARAVARGVIRLVAAVDIGLVPGSYRLPQTSNRGKE